MDPASGILMSGIDPNPGSGHGSGIDPHPGSAHSSGIDPNPGNPSQARPNGVVMQALTTTRSALVRPGEDEWFVLQRTIGPNLWQLDFDLLVTVIQKQLGQRLMVAGPDALARWHAWGKRSGRSASLEAAHCRRARPRGARSADRGHVETRRRTC